jgi:hypothetical protein
VIAEDGQNGHAREQRIPGLGADLAGVAPIAHAKQPIRRLPVEQSEQVVRVPVQITDCCYFHARSLALTFGSEKRTSVMHGHGSKRAGQAPPLQAMTSRERHDPAIISTG